MCLTGLQLHRHGQINSPGYFTMKRLPPFYINMVMMRTIMGRGGMGIRNGNRNGKGIRKGIGKGMWKG